MKTSFKMVAMLLGIGIFPVCAHAQKKVVIEDEEPNSIMFVSRDKAGDEIIRIMNDRSQMRFHDPNAPRFLLTDQKGKFALGIGGYVRATAEYDFNGIVDDVDFYPALIGQPGKEILPESISDGHHHFYPIPEIGRTNQASGRLRGVYRRKLPWRWEDV